MSLVADFRSGKQGTNRNGAWAVGNGDSLSSGGSVGLATLDEGCGGRADCHVGLDDDSCVLGSDSWDRDGGCSSEDWLGDGARTVCDSDGLGLGSGVAVKSQKRTSSNQESTKLTSCRSG